MPGFLGVQLTSTALGQDDDSTTETATIEGVTHDYHPSSPSEESAEFPNAVSLSTAPSGQPGNTVRSSQRPRRVTGLRRWEGRIQDISDGLLSVELIPADHEGPPLVADLRAELLGPDLNSARPGDIVYLTTRMVYWTGRYPTETSSLKLRRPGPWDAGELQEIHEAARQDAEFFKTICLPMLLPGMLLRSPSSGRAGESPSWYTLARISGLLLTPASINAVERFLRFPIWSESA